MYSIRQFFVKYILLLSILLGFPSINGGLIAQEGIGFTNFDLSKELSEEARRKLDHWLIFPIIEAKRYLQTPKSAADRERLNKQLDNFASVIAIDLKESEPAVDVLIKTRNSQALRYNKKLNIIGVHKGKDGNFVTARVKLADLEDIALDKDVIFIEAARNLYPLLDDSVPDINADDVWGGNVNYPIADSITGKGVYVGIIEFELPRWSHVTFRDRFGNTRFRKLRVLDSNNQPIIYDDPSRFPPPSINNLAHHATHVAGIAAGRGNNGQHRGVAYEADLLWSGLRNLGDVNGTTGNTNDYLEALQWMIDEATAAGKPLVVNASLGALVPHPHDGSTLFEQAINSKITENKILVQAAGNFGYGTLTSQYNFHYRGVVPDNGNTIMINAGIPFLQYSNNELEIEIWYDGNLAFDVRVADENNFWSDWVSFGSGLTAILDPNDDDYVLIYNNGQSSYTTGNNDNVIFLVFQSGNNLIDEGVYHIELRATNNGPGGSFDVYSSYPTGGEPYRHGFVHLYNGDHFQTIAVPGYAQSAITVVAHGKEIYNNDIAYYSSRGPSRTDDNNTVSKPDIAAPGGNAPQASAQWIQSAVASDDVSFGYFQGTSQAAPHVTGAIALLLQKFPGLTANDVKMILQNSAGPLPNGHWQGDGTLTIEDRKYWGAGRLDILAAYEYMVGFVYGQTFVYRNKFQNVFHSHPNNLTGIPIEPVVEFVTGFYKQKMTNGGIVYRTVDTDAYWMGEGIWDYWVYDLNGLISTPLIGYPASSEYDWGGLARVDFTNGYIVWDPNTQTASHVVYDSIPPSTITDLQGVGSSTTSITIQWTAPGDDGNVGTAAKYHIDYRTGSPPTNNNFQSIITLNNPQPAGSPESYTITGLAPSTYYYIAIKAEDDAGLLSDISNVIHVNTTGTTTIDSVAYVSGAITSNTTWGPSNILYVVNGGLTVAPGVTLTIQPGVIVKMAGSYIMVQGTLIADGDPDNRIIFTSIKDDSYGGDTNGDGSSSVPGPGDWYSL
ncbi:MAG: hypothetical protein D6748_16540, partial [Calditrichaeota bacterium]